MDMMWFRRRGLMVTPHTESVTGAIASFNSDYNKIRIKSLICGIEPIQEGTGDPSPDNVRPISGRTGVSVVRSRKNLFPAINGAEYSSNLLSVVCNNGEYTYTTGSGDLSISAILPAYAVDDLLADKKSIPAGTYTFSVAVSQWGSNTELVTSSLKLMLTDNVTGSTVDIRNGQTATLTHDCTIYAVSCDRAYTMQASSVTKYTVQLETGTTATEYEPYQADTYSVNWKTEAGTVYGGYVDVVSGKLTITHRYWTDDGSRNWLQNQDGSFYVPLEAETPVQVEDGCYCNYCKYVVGFSGLTVFARANGLMALNSGWDSVYPDVSSLKAAFTHTPLQVVYKMATPIEIQLTPQEVRTLLGVNNIWCDSGNVSVDYWKWGK